MHSENLLRGEVSNGYNDSNVMVSFSIRKVCFSLLKNCKIQVNYKQIVLVFQFLLNLLNAKNFTNFKYHKVITT